MFGSRITVAGSNRLGCESAQSEITVRIHHGKIACKLMARAFALGISSPDGQRPQ